MNWLILAALHALTVQPTSAPPPWGFALYVPFTLQSDHQTKGGGAGLGAELGYAKTLGDRPRAPFAEVRARFSVLGGAGLAYTAGIGAALAWPLARSWTPEVGLSLETLMGALIRTIDVDGNLAANPLSLQLDLHPLRFDLHDSWISVASVHLGPTLGRRGAPPAMITIALVEIGRRF